MCTAVMFLIIIIIVDTHSSKRSSDGITQLHFVGKFGGFAVALESSSEGHNLLLASLKGLLLTTHY